MYEGTLLLDLNVEKTSYEIAVAEYDNHISHPTNGSRSDLHI